MVVPSALPERSHILLTGASGLIGARVLTFLLSKDYTVIATDIVPLPPHLPPLTSPSTFHIIDLLDHLSLERVLQSSSLKINGVIHLAAIPHPLNRDPREVFANNAVTNYNVLRTVLDLGVERVVQASSVNAAGLTFTAPERQRFDALPLNEESPMRPVRDFPQIGRETSC
jgi:nucleoside-diphosphate-sugar epimerase